ncbi:MAG: hypothetical protein CL607_15690 [Anaerolineaceae bacterium]|mgnify:CR=1 FL=1|nr:hypothetical protein [Anaerolineaceae bacterium]
METLEELLDYIDGLPLAETTKSEAKFIITARRVDKLASRHDLERLEHKLTLRFGGLLAVGIGLLAAIDKLL